MEPTLKHGRIVVAKRPRHVKTNDVVVIHHNGIEKIKRVSLLNNDSVYVEGDNSSESTDSRMYGWIDRSKVVGKVIWPRL